MQNKTDPCQNSNHIFEVTWPSYLRVSGGGAGGGGVIFMFPCSPKLNMLPKAQFLCSLDP